MEPADLAAIVDTVSESVISSSLLHQGQPTLVKLPPLSNDVVTHIRDSISSIRMDVKSTGTIAFAIETLSTPTFKNLESAALSNGEPMFNMCLFEWVCEDCKKDASPSFPCTHPCAGWLAPGCTSADITAFLVTCSNHAKSQHAIHAIYNEWKRRKGNNVSNTAQPSAVPVRCMCVQSRAQSPMSACFDRTSPSVLIDG